VGNPIDWQLLSHAYGPAGDIPALLDRARTDRRPVHVPGSAWFDLWSALCHQGDAYTASYAAAPALVEIAQSRRHTPEQFDSLHLLGCIELARLEQRGPQVPEGLAAAYHAAMADAPTLVSEALSQPWPTEFRDALQACAAALRGDPATARALFDRDMAAEGE
jgi:hypothetical protein